MKVIFIILCVTTLVALGCSHKPQKAQPAEATLVDPHPGIPQLVAMPDPARSNIRKACHERWVLKEMNMKTFHVRPDHDGFLITCESTVDGELYLNTIRTDKDGNWVNDGRTKKDP